MKQLIFNLTLLISLTMAPLSAWANCQQADNLFKQAKEVTNDSDQQIKLLKQATRLCPNHREAHYQLADLQKQAQQWAEAEWLYKHVIELDSNDALAYAELGEVLMERKDYHQAAAMFNQFLTLANKDNKKAELEEEIKHYRTRLEVAEQKIIELSHNKIAQLANNKGIRPGQIDIQVRFEYGSHQIKKHDETWQQCQKMANEINQLFGMTEFEKTRIRVEGHTDSIGSAHYNEILSKQRASRVKEVLVNDFQVAEERLEVIGMGEEHPIASNETPHGRFLNRRVTLVKINR
jgi:outer membrane protein OmpA-like peptidoglycan-associated protein